MYVHLSLNQTYWSDIQHGVRSVCILDKIYLVHVSCLKMRLKKSWTQDTKKRVLSLQLYTKMDGNIIKDILIWYLSFAIYHSWYPALYFAHAHCRKNYQQWVRQKYGTGICLYVKKPTVNVEVDGFRNKKQFSYNLPLR